MSYYTPNMMKASAAADTRTPALGIQLDPNMHTAAPSIPPMLRLHAEQNKGSGLKISLTPTAAPARLSIYPCDTYGSDDARPKAVACTQDNLIRQIPRLRESLSALDEEIHSEMNTPDHAETMRIHSKILQLQDKRMNEVEGRLNTLAKDGDQKNELFEKLHHVSGRHIMDMSEKLKDMQSTMDVHGQLKGGDDYSARSVDSKLRDLTQAGEISMDIVKKCQDRIGDIRQDLSSIHGQVQDTRHLRHEIGELRQDISSVARKVEHATHKQLRGEAGETGAGSATNEALLREVAMSVMDVKKMLGASKQDVASLARKVEHMETKLNTSQLHAETFNLLQRDMLSSNRPKKTRS